jgi:hypothetical protein
MFHYRPFDPMSPHTTYYAEYTSTTSIPSYTLQQHLRSLSDRQSRLYTERRRLDDEERQIKRQRQVILRRLRAQRLRDAIEAAEIEHIMETIVEHERDGEQAIAEAVMYPAAPCSRGLTGRNVLSEAKRRELTTGGDARREIYRELKVREMIDPSPRGPYRFVRGRMSRTCNEKVYLPRGTPIVKEIPLTGDLPRQGYVPAPTTGNSLKRGSRRTIRVEPSYMPREITLAHPLESYALLREKLQFEVSAIPVSIRRDMSPTPEERIVLGTRVAHLEEILDEVDAVPFDPDADEGDKSRRVRRELVSDIVTAITGIEQVLLPSTPNESPEKETTEEESDEDTELFDREINRVIQETLARKKDDEGDGTREGRSVTVEDVEDLEY